MTDNQQRRLAGAAVAAIAIVAADQAFPAVWRLVATMFIAFVSAYWQVERQDA